MRSSIALLATLALTTSLSAARVQYRISVPRAKAPVVDGKVGTAEWKGAVHIALLNNEAEAMLLHDGNYLYVAIVGIQPGIASVCAQGKSGVRILHASAALGTAAFDFAEGKWKLAREFTWTNRDTGESAAAMADRETFLKSSGWFANTSPTAMKTREYQIPVRGQKEIPLAIGYHTYTPTQQTYAYWPVNLEDSCADAELAAGHTDGVYEFEPSQWGVVQLK